MFQITYEKWVQSFLITIQGSRISIYGIDNQNSILILSEKTTVSQESLPERDLTFLVKVCIGWQNSARTEDRALSQNLKKTEFQLPVIFLSSIMV